jgi:hypothetical protein
MVTTGRSGNTATHYTVNAEKKHYKHDYNYTTSTSTSPNIKIVTSYPPQLLNTLLNPA